MNDSKEQEMWTALEMLRSTGPDANWFAKQADEYIKTHAPEWLQYLLDKTAAQADELERHKTGAQVGTNNIETASTCIDYLDEEIKTLRSRLREIDSHGPEGRNRTNAQYVALLQANIAMREGLQFYAEKKHMSIFWQEDGGRARKALEYVPDIPLQERLDVARAEVRRLEVELARQDGAWLTARHKERDTHAK